jgi:hypothetical protein
LTFFWLLWKCFDFYLTRSYGPSEADP